MSSADASILFSNSMLFQKYLQSRYQITGMYPVTVMMFCVGLSEMDTKMFHCSLIQSTVSENLTPKSLCGPSIPVVHSVTGNK